MKLDYVNKQIAQVSNTKFLGTVIEISLPWKHHMVKILPKPSTACYAIRSVKPRASR